MKDRFFPRAVPRELRSVDVPTAGARRWQVRWWRFAHGATQYQTQGDDALRFLDEDRGGQEQRIFQKAKATFDPTLILVGRHQLLIGERLALQLIGSDDETSFAQGFFVHLLLIDADRRHDLPLVGHGTRLFARTPLACMASMSHNLTMNLHSRLLALEFPLQGRPCIRFTGKAPRTQIPPYQFSQKLSINCGMWVTNNICFVSIQSEKSSS